MVTLSLQTGQPLVDASFLALIRCPWLWKPLDNSVRAQLVTAFKQIRDITPGKNWILFSGMIDAFFCKYCLPRSGLNTASVNLNEFNGP
ncbi:MAG: DUF2264 domain-containing protein [Bacteroidota bacterium]